MAATVRPASSAGSRSLIAVRFVLGFGEGAAFPTATRAMATWMPRERWGFAQGITHSAARLGNALTPPLVALIVSYLSWRGSFFVRRRSTGLGPAVALDLAPQDGCGACAARRPAEDAVAGAGPAHAAGDGGRFLLRLDALAVPQLDSVVLL